ncbi:hypothetical protein SSX86_016398 [Deinandra increscens subsp. villosa]|uniref:RRM domain-containing protein n=1 Tax=Deinandra increscens subsp. villosa TaxID=3103831 RepID=A0AAP0D2L7_9ASTR
MFPNFRNRKFPHKSKPTVMQSNYKDLQNISKSIFITNFPSGTTVRDLWSHCAKWGTVSDLYIASRLSKSGKRFGFARFIGVKDVDALIGNLRTIWIGSFHLFADYVREGNKHDSHSFPPLATKANVSANQRYCSNNKSFADMFKQEAPSKAHNSVPIKRIVIPIEDCLEAGKSEILMGKVVDPLCIPNIPSFFVKEGFMDVRFRYIGGRWIGISFPNATSALKFEGCLELKKYFSSIQPLDNSFIPDERVVWIDLRGLPVVASTPIVIKKLGELWGEFMFFGNNHDEPLAYGKVCIITKNMIYIDEVIEVSIDNHSFMVKALEFENWAPSLHFHEDSMSSDESDSGQSSGGWGG